jgi:hypothetical protein
MKYANKSIIIFPLGHISFKEVCIFSIKDVILDNSPWRDERAAVEFAWW